MFNIVDRHISRIAPVEPYYRPYYFNERATLSLFAGGVWQSQPENLVLEEFTVGKERQGTRYDGRSDIWFEAEDQWCYAEAKQVIETTTKFTPQWVESNIGDRLREEADAVLCNVEFKKDLERFANEPVSRGRPKAFGMLFVVPFINQQNGGRALDDINVVRDRVHASMLAVTAGGTYRVLRASYFRDDLLSSRDYLDWKGKRYNYPCLEVLICEKGRT
jgi:hypothetical protein